MFCKIWCQFSYRKGFMPRRVNYIVIYVSMDTSLFFFLLTFMSFQKPKATMRGIFLLSACLLALVFMATLTEAKPVAKKPEKATKNLEATTKGEDKNNDENEKEDKSEDESKGKNQSGSGLNDGKEIVK